jgi:GMP synthase (glutamine-hydrolysing)
MGKIVIAKAGSTFPALATRRGDFEHWILAGMQVDEDQASVVDVAGGASLLGYDGVEGVVVTGSHAMVTEQRPWSERLAE